MTSYLADSWTNEDWTTIWTAVTGVGTVGLFFGALGAALIARGQLREATRARVDAVAPYVVIYMEQSKAGLFIFDLVCKNFGQTAASNVTVKFDPPVLRVGTYEGEEPRRIGWPALIPTLAPGQEFRIFWDEGSRHTAAKVPQSHTADVRYESIHGDQLTSKAVLEWDIMAKSTMLDIKNIHQVAQSLDNIDKSLKNFREELSDGSGVAVYVRDGYRHDQAKEQSLARQAKFQKRFKFTEGEFVKMIRVERLMAWIQRRSGADQSSLD